MSFIQSAEGDFKTIANNMMLNAGSLILFDKVLSQYVVSNNDSDLIKTLKAAGLVTCIEEVKAVLARAGYDIRIFK